MDVSTATLTQAKAVASAPAARAAGHRHSYRADFLIAVSLAGDAATIFLGMMVGFWVRFKSGWEVFTVPTKVRDFGEYFGLMIVGTAFFLAAFVHLGLYDHRHLLRFRRTALIILKASAFWFCAYLGVSLALKFDPPISRIYVTLSVLSCVGLVLLWRFVFSRCVQSETIARHLRQKVLLVGWNPEVHRLVASIQDDPSHPYEVVGYVPNPNGSFHTRPMPGVKQLGDFDDIEALIRNGGINILILADPDMSNERTLQLAELCEREYVQFKKVPSYFQILVSGLQLETISGVPILGVSELPLNKLSSRFLKRALDIAGALVGLAISLPIILLCGWRIRRENPGPIFFGQERIGRNGRRFTMWKLRSMKLGADLQDHLNQSTLRDDPRVLKIGALMRRWNLDETPQFWNVLLGDMSLVGPRPERTYHSEKLSLEIPHYNARYNSKPGLTGWAQVHGFRGDTDLVARVQYDLYYLENWSFWLDLQIMLLTFLNRKNAY